MDKGILYCSFCGKSQHEAKKLIAGPDVYICDECTNLCYAIVLESRAEDAYKKALEEKGLVLVARSVLEEKGLIAKPGSSLDKFQNFMKNKTLERSLEELNWIMKGACNV